MISGGPEFLNINPYFFTFSLEIGFFMILSVLRNKEFHMDLPGKSHKVKYFIEHFTSQIRKYYKPNKKKC